MPYFFRSVVLFITGFVATSCGELSQTLDGSLGPVEVIETPPAIAVTAEPELPRAQVAAPQFVDSAQAQVLVRHVVRVSVQPSSAKTLSEVQSFEIDVEVEGGNLGTRQVSAVFVSPLGQVWEKQVAFIDAVAGQTSRAHFSLPVAATFIENQRLAGIWQLRTLDDGIEHGSANFALEE